MNNEDFLKTYNADDYKHPSVTIDLLVFTITPNNKLCVLTTNREQAPFENCFALPGGFIDLDKSLEDSAKDILYKKTGLKDIEVEQLYTFGDVDRDPRTRVLSVAYFALVPYSKLANRVNTSTLVDLTELMILNERNAIAFDHYHIIKVAVDRIRGKLNYVPLVFNLVGNKNNFTIYEVQKIYEAIYRQCFNAANFRRDFINRFVRSGYVVENGLTSTEHSRKACKCYKLA